MSARISSPNGKGRHVSPDILPVGRALPGSAKGPWSRRGKNALKCALLKGGGDVCCVYCWSPYSAHFNLQ